MDLKVGIIGLPNVGKSTLFNTLTEMEVNAANYPFATVDPNIGVVGVPDERLDKVHGFYEDKAKKSPVVEFVDIAGLVKKASQGEGLGNQFLAQVREVQILVHVVRVFEGRGVAHVEGDIHPVRDLEIIENELREKDLETVGKRLDKTKDGEEIDKLNKIKESLESGDMPEPSEIAEEMNLLSIKPQLILLNGEKDHVDDDLKEEIKSLGFDYLVVDLDEDEEIPDLIKKSYDLLNVITFFTIGDDEVRGWTIEKGSSAPEAAGAVHSDFQENFVKAEVVSWKDLVESGGWNKAKNDGLVRLKGKDYVVEDGDVILFKAGA